MDTENEDKNAIDWGLFHEICNNCEEPPNDNNIIPYCSYLKRISVALKYYEMLCNDNKSQQRKENKQLLVQFCVETYTALLDDYVHFIQVHSDNKQLLQIKDELMNTFGLSMCDLSQCKKLNRHYRANTNENENKEDIHADDSEFQNDLFTEGRYQSFFDCSWISHYGEENERLFISGEWRLRIESIRIIETGNNYEEFVHAFHVFDRMISGVDGGGDILPSDIHILDSMINNKLGINKTKNKLTCDKYIIDIFDLFLNDKTHIEIYLHDLNAYYKETNHLIMHSLVNEGIDDHGNRVIDHLSDIDLTNVLNCKIFDIFPNLNQIVINTTYGAVTLY